MWISLNDMFILDFCYITDEELETNSKPCAGSGSKNRKKKSKEGEEDPVVCTVTEGLPEGWQKMIILRKIGESDNFRAVIRTPAGEVVT